MRGVNLSIDKSSSPGPVMIGQPITYTITVTNSGDEDATGVIVEDDVP